MGRAVPGFPQRVGAPCSRPVTQETVMEWKLIAQIVKSLRSAGAQVVPQRNWIQLTNAQGVRMYVQNPGKNGNVGKVHLTGHGYDGRVAGQEIPVDVVMHDELGLGAVAFELSLATPGAPAFLARLVEAFPTLQAQPKPGGRRGGRRAGPAIDVAGDLGL